MDRGREELDEAACNAVDRRVTGRPVVHSSLCCEMALRMHRQLVCVNNDDEHRHCTCTGCCAAALVVCCAAGLPCSRGRHSRRVSSPSTSGREQSPPLLVLSGCRRPPRPCTSRSRNSIFLSLACLSCSPSLTLRSASPASAVAYRCRRCYLPLHPTIAVWACEPLPLEQRGARTQPARLNPAPAATTRVLKPSLKQPRAPAPKPSTAPARPSRPSSAPSSSSPSFLSDQRAAAGQPAVLSVPHARPVSPHHHPRILSRHPPARLPRPPAFRLLGDPLRAVEQLPLLPPHLRQSHPPHHRPLPPLPPPAPRVGRQRRDAVLLPCMRAAQPRLPR